MGLVELSWYWFYQLDILISKIETYKGSYEEADGKKKIADKKRGKNQ